MPQTEVKPDPHPGSPDGVFAWRMESFMLMGYGAAEAELMAWNTHIEIHKARALLARGCSLELALDILY